MPLVKRYIPGAFPQFAEVDENLRGYLRDEFAKISQILGNTGDVTDAGREVVQAPRSYFVRTDGNDTNNGLSNTPTGAFLTIQRAIDVLSDLDFNGFTPQVFVAAGTYTAGVNMTAPFLGGVAQLIGDTTTPSNVVISTTSTNCIYLANQSSLQIAGFKLQSTAAHGLHVDEGSFVNVFGKMEYGACPAGAKILANRNSFIEIFADYTVSGNSTFLMLASSTSEIMNFAALTITLSGNPAITYNAFSQIGSLIYLDPVTWVGSCVGYRFIVSEAANITTGGRGPNFIPGTNPGIAQLNGVYT